MIHAEIVASTEKWFVKRGIPHFIDDYSASRDVLTRSLPILTLVFLAELVSAVNLEDGWPWWANVAALAAAVGLASLSLVASNLIRKRKLFQRFDDVGRVEIFIFILVPSLIPTFFGGQVGQAISLFIGNLLLLAVIYLGTSYGVVPMTRWALGRTFTNLKDVYGLFVRAMPLLLLFVTFLFLTTEVWQAASAMSGIAFAVSLLLFVGIGVAFALFKLPDQLNDLTAASGLTHEKIVELTDGTPIGGEARSIQTHVLEPLSKRQWLNLGLLLLFSEGVQIVLVTLFIFAFLFILSMVTATDGVVGSWLGSDPNVFVHLTWLGDNAVITEEALLVCGFLATFSGLYFTVYLLTDASYRAEFLEDMLTQLRQNIAVRATYLNLVAREKVGIAQS